MTTITDHHFDGQQQFRHILFAAAKVLPRSDTKCCPATECSIFELFRFQVHAWRSLGGKESWAFATAKDVGTTIGQPLDNPLKVVESQPPATALAYLGWCVQVPFATTCLRSFPNLYSKWCSSTPGFSQTALGWRSLQWHKVESNSKALDLTWETGWP